MMRFELGLEEPDPKRAVQSALTIAASYVAGGIIPLAPYMCMHSARMALVVVGGGHPARAGSLRLHQGALHRLAAGSLRLANRCDWWTCCRSGLPAGQADLLTQYGKTIYVRFLLTE